MVHDSWFMIHRIRFSDTFSHNFFMSLPLLYFNTKLPVLAKSQCFWPKMVIFGPKLQFLGDQYVLISKLFFSSTTSFRSVIRPLAQCIWPGCPKMLICVKTACFGPKWLSFRPNGFWVVSPFGLIYSFQMSHNMTPYLKGCLWAQNFTKSLTTPFDPPRDTQVDAKGAYK